MIQEHGRRRATRSVGPVDGAFGTVDVNVTMNASLVRAARLATDVDPAMNAIELEVECLAVRPGLLAVTAPAFDEPVGPGSEPFFIPHECNIGPRRETGNRVFSRAAQSK
jgi:hypothetical protein